jgi:EmrB/QacA subfamily drug resistance transporter
VSSSRIDESTASSAGSLDSDAEFSGGGVAAPPIGTALDGVVRGPLPPDLAPGEPAVPDGPEEEKPVDWRIPLAVVIVGMFMSVLDMSIINVAVPAIRADYGSSTDNIQWISTAYSLTEGVAVPAAAWFGMRFGLRRVYVVSLIGFTIASALCGLADNLGQMVLFRILQAIPGGLIPVTCLTILFKMVPMNKIGAAMGLFGLGVTFAPGAGPSLGGYLVEYLNWRMVFYINVPIGILGVIAALAVLPKFPAEARRPFDAMGFLTIAGSLFAMLLALEEGPKWGWTSYPTLILLAVAANLMALFVFVELQVKHPLLDLRVFTYWPFVNSMILNSAISIGLFATMFYIPSFLQSAKGLTPWNAGLVMAPLALVLMVMMPVTGRLFDRFGARWLAVIGLLINSTGMLLLSQLSVDMSRTAIVVGTMIMAGGTGLAMMPIMTGGLSAVPPHLADYASGFNTLIQRVSAGLGLAGMTAMVAVQRAQFMSDRSSLLSATGANADPRLVAMQGSGGDGGLLGLWSQLGSQVQAQTYSNAFLVAGSLTAVGVLLALFLPVRRPAGAEMVAVH